VADRPWVGTPGRVQSLGHHDLHYEKVNALDAIAYI
jgi:hypothetical protein